MYSDAVGCRGPAVCGKSCCERIRRMRAHNPRGMNWFNSIGAVLCALFAVGCAHNNKFDFSRPGDGLSSSWSISPEYTLSLISQTPYFRYELEENSSNKLIATAESAITKLDVTDGSFRGTQDIESIPHGSFVIREDVSDAVAEVRYILFEKVNNEGFRVFYLDVPFHTRMEDQLPTEAPYIICEKGRRLSLLYLPSQKRVNVELDSIKKSSVPFNVR